DLARIHAAMWIESVLHIAECLVDLPSKQFFVQVTSREPVAVLSAHAPAELHHKIRDLISHVFHDLDVPRIFRIDQRTDVQAADACVAVIAGGSPELVDDIPESYEEFRQLRRFDCAIFYERDWFALTFHAEQQAES